MSVRRRLLLIGAGAVLLVFLSVGVASAADTGAGDSLGQSTENVTTTQQDNSTENETGDLPVEPPSQSHPGYEYVRQEDDTDAKIKLGKQLFLDPRISETGTISCNSCHNIMEGGDQSVPKGVGVHGQTGPVNSPTVWNSAFHTTQFWDGRAATLADQAEGPIVADVEMGMPDHQAALDRVRNVSGYVESFDEVYGDEVGSDDPDELITLETVTDAIAAYERTLVTPNSSYDQYVEGDADELTEQQLDGMQEFMELGCQSCHSGPMFSGQWENPESGEFYGMKHPTYPDNEQCQEYVDEYDLMENPGRAGVTDDEADQYVYKVPTLRNVEHTAPYMHTGQVRTLDEAVRVMGACQLNTELSDEQVTDLSAFLTSLTGEYPDQSLPRLPAPSGESMIPVNANGTLVDAPADDSEQGSEAAGGDGGIGASFLVVLVAVVVVVAVAVIAFSRRNE